ncbi:MAG: hypothetical protein QOH43_705 [Solirubrobacteraceae bacterium]|jgi:hypothetical protein|nr:hypothetical protein [Solirubrobacteraceae bacterium]
MTGHADALRARRLRSPGALLAGVWLVAVVAISATLGFREGHLTQVLACSPARLASGDAWTLLTSAMIIDGPPVPQILGAALVIALVVQDYGARVLWGTMILGHVGATLVAYAGIGLLWLVDRDDVRSVVHAPDYGISAIWAAALGAVAIAGARPPSSHPRFGLAVAILCVLVLVVLIPAHGELADVEHLLAFILGAGVGLAHRRTPAMAAVQPGEDSHAALSGRS